MNKKRKLKKWVKDVLLALVVIASYDFVFVYGILQYCSI